MLGDLVNGARKSSTSSFATGANSSGWRARCDFVVESSSPETALLDEQSRPCAAPVIDDVAPLQGERLTGAEALVRKDADQRGVG
jgi:hypothetical protein